MNKKIRSLFVGVVALAGLVGCGGNGFDSSAAIKVYTRDTTSGTRDGFFSTIGLDDAAEDDAPLVEGFITVPGNGDMIAGVKGDEYGIGYISLASLSGSGVKALNYEGVEPTEANVNNKTYKLTRNFNYLIREFEDAESAEAQLVEAFVAYMGTSEGKTVIQSKDGIVAMSASDPSWNNIKSDYPIVEEDNSDVTLNFGGSTSVEKVAKELSATFSALAGNFTANHNHSGSGDAWKRAYGAEKDGENKLHVGFASREFKAEEAMPAANHGLVCVDAIVPVVNEANTVLTNVTADTLVDIYTGEAQTWADVA